MVAARPSEQAGISGKPAASNDLNMRELLDEVAIAGQHDPDIGEGAERSGEGSGNGTKSADADEVVHLRGNE